MTTYHPHVPADPVVTPVAERDAVERFLWHAFIFSAAFSIVSLGCMALWH